MASTEAQKRAGAKYDAENAKYISLKLNRKTDQDIIRFLDTVPNIQGFIKQIIRERMEAGS